MDFEVRRDDLSDCRTVESEPPELEPGETLLSVDAFGLTSNNISYAVLGEEMSYWEFFPAEDGWGRIPVWGFADVAGSEHPGLEAGTRVFGYLPPSTHLVVRPDRAGEHGFVDSAPHRSQLPAAYQRYTRVETDSAYDPSREDEQMLLRPLFFTSFLLDDFLADNGFFDAEAIVLSSASSKTALATAFLLSRRDSATRAIGLTSARNVEFVAGTGAYERVISYEALDSLPRAPAVYLDMSGNAEVRERVHRHFGESLAHSAFIGMTHHDRLGGADDLPGPEPEFFFAPTQAAKRARDWGGAGLDERVAEAWRPFVEWCGDWLEIVHGNGPEALNRAYLGLLEGRAHPSVGHVLSLR